MTVLDASIYCRAHRRHGHGQIEIADRLLPDELDHDAVRQHADERPGEIPFPSQPGSNFCLIELQQGRLVWNFWQASGHR